MKLGFLAAGVAAAALMAGSAQAGVTVTYEAPGVTRTATTFSGGSGVETFDGANAVNGGFNSTFGDNGVISGTYSSGIQVYPNGVYGGEGGSNYAVTFDQTGYSLSLKNVQDPGAGVTYFGYYLPALDGGNVLELWSGATKIFTFSQQTVLTALQARSDYSDYLGKPDAPNQGGNGAQPYVFVNFYGTDGTTFDKIVFRESPEVGGYESDNHTVGYYKDITGTVPGVPEPATWAMMIIGFGAAGAMVRNQRRRTGLAAL